MKRSLVLLGFALATAGCGDDSSTSGVAGQGGTTQTPDGGGGEAGADDAGKPDTSQPDTGVDAEPDAEPPVEAGDDAPVANPCASDQKLCLDHDTRKFCANGAWQEETCPAGSGCYLGQCVPGGCTDECRLGETSGGQTCELLELTSGSWVTPDPAANLHDRARLYEQWLHRDGMAHGGVGNAAYSDPPSYTDVVSLGGLGDSAIWTGTYLASEAMRLKATGAADARANVVQTVNTLHLWFNVAGDPGMLARFVAPTGAAGPPALSDLQCGNSSSHCNVAYQGAQYDYIGHISRDQYQGVMLGYALAYEALGENDEDTRELIRQDVVELMQELMKERTIPLKVTYNGNTLPALDVTMRFSVVNTAELDNGAVSIVLDTANPDSSEMYGFQEFMPNLAPLLKQVPVVGLLVPATIPRAGSAIMLASFFNVGLLVTDGIPAYETEHDEMLTFYEANTESGGNVNDWISIMMGWSYAGSCGDAYYANNIAMEPMYNLARLEVDLVRRGIIRTSVLQDQMWPEFDSTKNPFFSYIYASTVPGVPASVHSSATAQLTQFPPAPRVKVPVDLTNDPKYQPHQSGCADQTSHDNAVDVGERVVSDFIWQRNPWGLLDSGNPAQTYPGVDYLVAYWMGRHHTYIPDDTAGRCTAWH